MIGQELTSHLQYIQKLLSTLMNSYEDYQSRKSQEKEPPIPLARHILFILGIVAIIITATLTISSFIKVARPLLLTITIGQMILAISVYTIVIKKDMKDREKKDNKSVLNPKSSMSIYELDQLRFNILQNLAKSPIPPTHLTPTSVNRMLQLVESGMCISLEESLRAFDKEVNKQKHNEELELMKHLQMISYH